MGDHGKIYSKQRFQFKKVNFVQLEINRMRKNHIFLRVQSLYTNFHSVK